MKKRTIFIWDIHWCFDEFELLLAKLKIQESDTVYIVWDIINKWPKSWKVLKFLYKNQNQFKAIKWNHEVWFLQWLQWEKPNFQCDTYEKLKNKLEKHPKIFNFFKNLPILIEKDNFLMIHWGLNPDKKLLNHSTDELTLIREINNKPWYEQYKWDKKVIYGHWAMNWLNIFGNTIGLDWGCVYWKALHAYILETWDVVTQWALKCYKDVFIKD